MLGANPTFLGYVKVIIDPNVSLTRTNAETGEVTEALCWNIDGELHVHPDRFKQYFEPLMHDERQPGD